jgi:hypothetical protein
MRRGVGEMRGRDGGGVAGSGVSGERGRIGRHERRGEAVLRLEMELTRGSRLSGERGRWRLLMRHDVDDVNDRPVGNPKRRCDEHSSKFSLSYETKVCQSSRKKPNSRR